MLPVTTVTELRVRTLAGELLSPATRSRQELGRWPAAPFPLLPPASAVACSINQPGFCFQAKAESDRQRATAESLQCSLRACLAAVVRLAAYDPTAAAPTGKRCRLQHQAARPPLSSKCRESDLYQTTAESPQCSLKTWLSASLLYLLPKSLQLTIPTLLPENAAR